MKFTVFWKKTAERHLAQIWLDAADRASVTKAAHDIEKALKGNPNEIGESRDEENRIFFVPPLGVTFTVNELDCQVLVASVWYIKGKSS